MEKKKIPAKLIGAIGAVVAVSCIAVILLVTQFAKKEESYRSIQIYELKGKTTIEREGIGAIEAIENLYLESGDRILVGENSSARLKLDDDKYILVEENSVLALVAEGTKENSKTTIHLEQGAITNEIQNKLNENSSYDVTTPNSVMAVRGTIFRVEVSFDEEGGIYTKVSTYEGTVGSSLILPDGTKQEEVLLVVGGKEVIIHMDETMTEYLFEPQDIDYSQIPIEILEFLQEIVEHGTQLPGISLEEIQQLMEALDSGNVEEDTEEQLEKPSEEEAEEEEEDEKPQEQTGEEPVAQEEDENETEEERNENVPQSASQNQNQTPNVRTYTVTFSCDGIVFGKQTVEEGHRANRPKLAPAESGAWDFDFSEEITEDTVIEWKR